MLPPCIKLLIRTSIPSVVEPADSAGEQRAPCPPSKPRPILMAGRYLTDKRHNQRAESINGVVQKAQKTWVFPYWTGRIVRFERSAVRPAKYESSSKQLRAFRSDFHWTPLSLGGTLGSHRRGPGKPGAAAGRSGKVSVRLVEHVERMDLLDAP